ncbi:MAG: hypothetical protein MZV70_52785 [Desulfobacterales bacterium]|nr:hypothetical protein [Desulfobacterales bacterium]
MIIKSLANTAGFKAGDSSFLQGAPAGRRKRPRPSATAWPGPRSAPARAPSPTG